MSAGRVQQPTLIEGPSGPWLRVRESVSWFGHAVVYADWRQWLPAVESVEELRPLLGRHDFQRSTTLVKPDVRARFVVSRLLVRYAASAALGVPPEAVELAYKPGGRPYLRGCDQIEVSLSHTEDLIVVGLNRHGRIGVDVELSERRMRYSEVNRQMCTTAERALLADLPEPRQEAELRRIWTLKEAYTKALGQGMRMGFTQFGFDLSGRELCTPDGSPASHGEWTFGTFELGPAQAGRYLVSVACQDAGHGGVQDTAVATMLDEGFLGQVVELLQRGERQAGAAQVTSDP
ncbi:4'-phosphopantetheinyl transferase family protein [Kitasatospora azatica]|uniref:4'-phosphopantetheinyl transferase family protein n=1 Tax=Kitasatospora azatica TaxID=58347 RepID=UPI00068B80CF|nr:4'-phosphopantetheinyl transferase superfamily protein [Kitasatospora azatica]